MRLIICLCLVLLTTQLSAASGPQVIGYGVKSCRDYLAVFDGWEKGDERDIGQYLRYRSWFSGIVTGLSLATGMDVLAGVEVNGAMRRIQVYCDEHPDDDFFTASMDLIRILTDLGG
jgi:hypothetical protein